MEKTLNLILKKQDFEMIASGMKTEDCREFKPYYILRMCDAITPGNYREKLTRKKLESYITENLEEKFLKGTIVPKDFKEVRFRLGYSSRCSMNFQLLGISIKPGKGFVIKLGRIQNYSLECKKYLSGDCITT